MTEKPWLDPVDDCPDWQDGGDAEVLLKDGSVKAGELRIVDMTPGPDEAPLFEFFEMGDNRDEGGLSIFDSKVKGFRWLDEADDKSKQIGCLLQDPPK